MSNIFIKLGLYDFLTKNVATTFGNVLPNVIHENQREFVKEGKTDLQSELYKI